MITPEYSRRSNCPVCGWRHCPGCYDGPDEEPADAGLDAYADEAEGLDWTPITPADLYPLPPSDSRRTDDAQRRRSA